MKRIYNKKYEHLWKWYPLFFWYKCDKCKKEFRREHGWRALTPPIINRKYSEKYLCGSCAPDFETANYYFLYKKWMPKRPNPPRPMNTKSDD